MVAPDFNRATGQRWSKKMKSGTLSKLGVGKGLLEQNLRERITASFQNSKECCIFLVDLHAQPDWYRKRIFKDYLHDHESLMDDCIEDYLKPCLSSFFKSVIAQDQKELEDQEGGESKSWDEAIRDFIDQGKFNQVLRSFIVKEHLRRINRDYCSKIFYHSFKSHFDSCSGMGMVEMIKVGEKHPKTLEKMSLMQEYDDIRAALLKLQLTGKIDSLNYK